MRTDTLIPWSREVRPHDIGIAVMLMETRPDPARKRLKHAGRAERQSRCAKYFFTVVFAQPSSRAMRCAP